MFILFVTYTFVVGENGDRIWNEMKVKWWLPGRYEFTMTYMFSVDDWVNTYPKIVLRVKDCNNDICKYVPILNYIISIRK